jgi:hypothetical protein
MLWETAFRGNRDSLGSEDFQLSTPSHCQIRVCASVVVKDLTEIIVAPDTYQVSPEPVLMTAELYGALALCLHDEGRGVGGLLHLRFIGGTGLPSDVTDNTLSSVLVASSVGSSARRRGAMTFKRASSPMRCRQRMHASPPQPWSI